MTGRIALACALRGGRSCITHVRYDGLSRVSRPRRGDDAAHAVVAHLGPGIIGGDAYATDVDVETSASLLVTGQMATPVYARAGAPSSVHAAWRVAAGAALAVCAEPLMLGAAAQHHAFTSIDVAGGAEAIFADIVTVAAGARARMRTTARIDGRLVARDACDLRARDGAVATVLMICGDERHRAVMTRTLRTGLARAVDVHGGSGATAGALLVRATSARVWPLQRFVADLVHELRALSRLSRAAA